MFALEPAGADGCVIRLPPKSEGEFKRRIDPAAVRLPLRGKRVELKESLIVSFDFRVVEGELRPDLSAF